MIDTVVSASRSLDSSRESRTPHRQKHTAARISARLHGKFEANLDYMRFYFKKINISKYLQLG